MVFIVANTTIAIYCPIMNKRYQGAKIEPRTKLKTVSLIAAQTFPLASIVKAIVILLVGSNAEIAKPANN